MTPEDTHNDSFQALYEIACTLNSILEPRQLLEKVLSIAVRHLSAERGFVLLSDPRSEAGFSVAAMENFVSRQKSDEFAASSSVVNHVLSTGDPVLTFDAQADGRFDSSTSIVAQNILSIACVPLRNGDRVTGAVYLDSAKSRKAFTEDALKFLTVFGNVAAIAIDNAQRYSTLLGENELLRSTIDATKQFPTIIGKSAKWQQVLDVVQRILDVDAAVFLTGESGTGKELIARAIHDHGTRKGMPFVPINCSAIPEQLLESELFGHVRGSFTGATGDKRGLVEIAQGGTLFLDEVVELPVLLQSKILRLLQEKEYRRVGDTKNRTTDVRIIAATNRDPQESIKAGGLREDLFFRLNVIGIHLPPLRERKDDIPLLATYFLNRAAETYRRPVKEIHPDAMQVLLLNPWKGNVREFQNVIERAVVLSRETQLTKDDLLFNPSDQQSLKGSAVTLEEFERQIIEATLAEMGGNKTRTAERLGVSLRWLQYRLKEWSQG
jgi:Nif-specific regulatory protein